MRDYVAWHDAYAEPGSALHRRLQVVIELIGVALDGMPAGPCRFVSLCAGQGHDILTVAATHPRGADLVGRLVELDPGQEFAVGLHRLARDPVPFAPGRSLFTFVR